MRHSMRTLIGVMLVGWICCPAMAVESGRKWWHFGQGREADVVVPPQTAPPQTPKVETPKVARAASSAPVAQQSTLPAYPTTEQPEPRWMFSSPLAKVSWPRVHMPELPKPKLPNATWPKNDPQAVPQRNAWVEPQIQGDPLKPTAMQRFSERTHAAWDKTVDAVTPGDRSKSNPPSSRVARRDERSMWQKMFGSEEPKKKEGSQTIGEFIAQERIDP